MKTENVRTAVHTYWMFAPVSITVSAVSLLGLLTYLLGGYRQPSWIGLQAADIYAPLHWYRFVTYMFAHVSVVHWIWNSALLIMTGWAIEKRIPRAHVLFVIVASSVFGGVLFCILSQPNSILMGMGFAVNAHIGCLFACYVADRRNFLKSEKFLTTALISLKLAHLGVGLARIENGMNLTLLKCLVLLAAFLVSGKKLHSIKTHKKANQSSQSMAAP